MKRWDLKKTLLVLIFALASSCGSDNEVTGEVNNNPVDPINPVIVANTISELRAFIVNMSFPEQNTHYYTDFVFTERTTTVSGGFIKFTTWSDRLFDRSKEQYGSGYIISHEFGSTLADVQAGLLHIVDNHVAYQKINNCIWEVRDSYQDAYGIDVCKSIVANPVYKLSRGNQFPKVEYQFNYSTP